MATTIKTKSSTTAGKVPTTSDIEIAELAINLADQKLFSRSSTGVFEIGKPGETPSGDTGDRPASPSPGDIFYDTSLNQLVYWNGSAWVPVSSGGGSTPGALNDLTDVDTTGVSNGQVLNYENGTWKPVTPSGGGGGGGSNLGYTPAADKGTVTNDGGTDAELPAATTSEAGLLVALDKQKLDSVAPGADVTPDLSSYLASGDNVSELVNDANYITASDIPALPADLLKSGDNVSELTNDAGYITASDIPAAVTPSLQDVTDEGSTTTNKITAAGFRIDQLEFLS